MEKFLVTNVGFSTETDATEPMAVGSIQARTEGGKVVAVVGDSKYAEIVLQTSQGLLRTGLMKRDGITIEKIVKVAAVAKVTEFIPTGNFTDGGVAGIEITKMVSGIPLIGQNYETFEVAVMEGDSVANTITALTAQINANSKYVTAVAAATKITLTAIDATHGITIAGSFGFGTYTENVITAFVSPTNSGAQIAETELYMSAKSGNTRSKSYADIHYKQNMQTDLSKDYTLYILRFMNDSDDVLEKNNMYKQEVQIAVETSKADATLETALKLLNASTGL